MEYSKSVELPSRSLRAAHSWNKSDVPHPIKYNVCVPIRTNKLRLSCLVVVRQKVVVEAFCIRVAITPCCKEISFSLSAKIYSICIRVAITPCCKDISFSILSANIYSVCVRVAMCPCCKGILYCIACFQLKFTQVASLLPWPWVPAARIHHLACFS